MPDDLERYSAAFDEPFPLVAWRGTDDELRVVVDEALERGSPWEEGDLLERQGLDRPPEGAVL